MEDIFSIVIVLLIYAVAAGSARKKGAKRKAEKQKRAERKPQFEKAFERTAAGEGRESVRAFHEALRRAAPGEGASAPAAEQREQGCETSRVHLHEVTQAEMSAAAEGEDPCHGGHAPESAPAARELFPEEESEPSELARDVLRGVIMSEILTRPCDRRKRSIYGR
ncbi:MAG: hypothetical protein Q4G52_02400 [Clostridia bacterium]|nr:hypothetical protein [Clostridia bacterium]